MLQIKIIPDDNYGSLQGKANRFLKESNLKREQLVSFKYNIDDHGSLVFVYEVPDEEPA